MVNKKDSDWKVFIEGLIDFLDGRSTSSKQMGLMIENSWSIIVYNFYMLIFLFIFASVLLVLLTPVLLATENVYMRGVGATIHVGAGLFQFCHQLPYRSFVISGIPYPVCARDIGIYVGIVLGLSTVFYRDKIPLKMTSVIFPILLTLPILIDGVTQTILHLRESNNLLRLLTGSVFTFGWSSFIANRIVLWKYPDFTSRIGVKSILIDGLIVLCVILFLTFNFASLVGGVYMSRQEAEDRALKTTELAPSLVKSFYVSSLTPLTVSEDLFYENNRDVILDDIRNFDWAKRWANRYHLQDEEYTKNYFNSDNISVSFNNTRDFSFMSFFHAISEKEHRLGIWVIVLFNETYSQGDSVFVSSGRGEYYYFDAFSGNLMSKEIH